jgi:hypothetical protein
MITYENGLEVNDYVRKTIEPVVIAYRLRWQIGTGYIQNRQIMEDNPKSIEKYDQNTIAITAKTKLLQANFCVLQNLYFCMNKEVIS